MLRALVRARVVSLARPRVVARTLCATPAPPPMYDTPNLPPNVHLVDEAVLAPYEEEKLAFSYDVAPGNKFAKLLRFTADKSLQDAGEIQLDETVFGTPVRKDIIHRVVVHQRNNRRQNTSGTKSVGQVRGSGKKPVPQKGQGRARQGSKFAPHMRGGGRAFPKGRKDYKTSLPKKVRRFGMRATLTARLIENQVFVVDSFLPPIDDDDDDASGAAEATSAAPSDVEEGEAQVEQSAKDQEQGEDGDDEIDNNKVMIKTKDITAILDEMDWHKVMFIDKDDFTVEFKRAQNNIQETSFFRASQATVYEILRHKTVVFSKEGLEEVQDRLNEEKQKSRRLAKRALL